MTESYIYSHLFHDTLFFFFYFFFDGNTVILRRHGNGIGSVATLRDEDVVIDVDPSCVAYREGLLERRGDGESTNKYGLRCVRLFTFGGLRTILYVK